MRHRDSRRRLVQKPAHARMIKRNLLTSLLLYESVRTTRNRAKAVQPIVDRLIRNAKKQTPQTAIRTINRLVTDKNASRKVMEVLIKRYANRPSGLTTIQPLGSRQGDGAMLVQLTLIDAEIPTKEDLEEVKAPKKKAAPAKEKKAETATKEKKEESKKKDDAKPKKAATKSTTTAKKKS